MHLDEAASYLTQQGYFSNVNYAKSFLPGLRDGIEININDSIKFTKINDNNYEVIRKTQLLRSIINDIMI